MTKNTGAMRIGIDLRSLEGGAQHRGIGRYATQLIEALSRVDHHNEYVFFASHHKAEVPQFNLDKLFNTMQLSGKKSLARSTKFVRIVYLRPKALSIDQYDLDVFFHIDIQQPIIARRTPVVTVLFDLIPFLYSDIYQHVHFGGYTPRSLVSYARQKLTWKLTAEALNSYGKSTAVVSISEHSTRDLIKFFPDIDSKKIHSIPLAASQPPKADKAAEKKLEALGLKDYLFYVGGADPRKGLVNFIKMMGNVWEKHPDTQVVLAGKEVINMELPEARKLRDTIAKSSHPEQVIRMGFISDAELAWLYKNARAFVFPSIYEGFGLPILEAMQSGCPVVTYDNSSIPEVTGDAAIMVKDGTDMAPAINKLLSSAALRDKLIKAGYEQEKQFTWEKTARETLKILEWAGRRKS